MRSRCSLPEVKKIQGLKNADESGKNEPNEKQPRLPRPSNRENQAIEQDYARNDDDGSKPDVHKRELPRLARSAEGEHSHIPRDKNTDRRNDPSEEDCGLGKAPLLLLGQ